MQEKKENVNLQFFNQISLPKRKKKKITCFMYNSAALSTIAAGYNLINYELLDMTLLLGCSTGLWAFGNCISSNDEKYQGRLTIYQGCTLLAAFSFLLVGITKPETANIIISLFGSGNMFLLNREFSKEKKCYTLSKQVYTTQKDDQK